MYELEEAFGNLPPKERELVNVMSQHDIGCLVGHVVTHAVANGFSGVVNHGASREEAWETVNIGLAGLIKEALGALEGPFNDQVDEYLAAMDTETFAAEVQNTLDDLPVVTDADFEAALDVLDDANLLDTPPEITFPDGPTEL